MPSTEYSYYPSMPAGDNAKNEGGLKVNYKEGVGRSPVQRIDCRVQLGNVKRGKRK